MRVVLGLAFLVMVFAAACGSDLEEGTKKPPLPPSLDVRIDACQILLMPDATSFLDEKVLSYGYGLSASTCLYGDTDDARHLELTIADGANAAAAQQQFSDDRAEAQKAAEVTSVETVSGLGDEAYRVLATDESGAAVTFVVFRSGAVGAALRAKKPGSTDLSDGLKKLGGQILERLAAIPPATPTPALGTLPTLKPTK